MSGARDRLLGDARAGLTRKLAELAGRGDLDEKFAAWLLGPGVGLSCDCPPGVAASTPKNYRDVAALGFAAARQGLDASHREALRKGLLWLAGRPDCVAGSPAGFTTDAVALIGIALGARYIADAAVNKAVADWLAQFVTSSCTLPGVLDWERCLFLAAARIVDCPASLTLSAAEAVADVRVALRVHDLLPSVHRAYADADEELALGLMLEPVEPLSYAQAALRAAAFDSVRRSVQSTSQSHRFSIPARRDESTAATNETTMNDKPRTKVFLQYTWDSDAHQQQTVSLANTLRNPYGFEAMMDVFVPGMPPEGLPHWMLSQIEAADYVLVVCTESNKRRWEGHEPPGKGKGAKWEGGLITRILYLAELQNRKFIPVAFQKADLDFIPVVLSGAVYYDLSKSESFEGLIRHLSEQPAYVPAPLGATPVLPPRDVKPFKPGN